MSKDEPSSPTSISQLDTNTSTQLPPYRSTRPSRACTLRASARLAHHHQQQSEIVKKPKKEGGHRRKPLFQESRDGESRDAPSSKGQYDNKIVTQLLDPPETAQVPRWALRSMWEMASVLNFLNVFKDQLNVHAEFSAGEFETALITPNDTLSDIHIPLMKAIPPVTRMALTRDTWITVLCRKLRDWWHWVAEGDLPLVSSHGTEIEVYKSLSPGVRLVILRALCDIRVEQEDIRSFIDSSMKQGIPLSAFRKERIGGDSLGVNYWYEDDPVIGHRLYREIRKVEMKKTKMKGSYVLPCTTYQWETIASNLEEFEDVTDKLLNSKNRTEASLAKKLKIEMLPEIEKVHKKKERLLKKQHRQALLLDNFLAMDGLGPGRSLRYRKPVTYTFDEYDRSINEAIKVTKDGVAKAETATNGTLSGHSHGDNNVESSNSEDVDEDDDNEPLDRSNRTRQRPQRYSATDYVEAVSDHEGEFETDEEIEGEAVYDDDYLKKIKRRKTYSSSEDDEEYNLEEENREEEEEEEEESLSISEESDAPRKPRKHLRTRRGTKSRSEDDSQSGLRRSKRAKRNQINYRKYEISDSEESAKNENDEFIDSNGNSDGSEELEEEEEGEEAGEEDCKKGGEEKEEKEEKSEMGAEEEGGNERKRGFLDLNEAAPGSGFDDGTNSVKDDD